jgi:hypothetical protein
MPSAVTRKGVDEPLGLGARPERVVVVGVERGAPLPSRTVEPVVSGSHQPVA